MEDNTLKLLEVTRKDLHKHAEISEQEHHTQNLITQFLKAHTQADFTEISTTGVLATFDSGLPGPSIMIRGDIDGLPIQEVNTFEYRSKTEGVSHKCGHDGHTTILLGLAIQLTKNPISHGRVLLLFQPAEENGKGAQGVLDDPKFDTKRVDYVFALHNLPGFEKHHIVLKENEFTCHVKSIIIKLKGKTAHAAEPEYGINPAPVIAEIIQFAENQTKNTPSSPEFFLVTPIFITMGEKAYGISAGYGEVHLTIRSGSVDLMNKKSGDLQKFIQDRCETYSLIPEMSWTQVFYANVNHPEAVSVIRKAAQHNQLTIMDIDTPFKWGEDFGLFTQQFTGAMFGIGAGKDSPALHNPDYDFPDEITPTGIAIFHSIINEILEY